MKKTILLAFLLVTLSVPAAWGEGRWEIGLGGGCEIPSQGWGSAYSLGWGGELKGGYAFDDNFSILATAAGYIFQSSVPAIRFIEFEFIPYAKYAFGQADLKPYVLGGVGAVADVLQVDVGSTTLSNSNGNFGAQAGAGLELKAGPKLKLTLELKYTHVFASYGQFSYLPINLAVSF